MSQAEGSRTTITLSRNTKRTFDEEMPFNSMSADEFVRHLLYLKQTLDEANPYDSASADEFVGELLDHWEDKQCPT